MATTKWSEMDDDEASAENAEALVVGVEGDVKTTARFVHEGKQLVKLITRLKLHRVEDRTSKATEELRRRMRESMSGPKGEAPATEDIAIEFPRQFRKADDDEADDLDTGGRDAGGFGGMRFGRDTVKDRFNALARLDGEKEFVPMTEDLQPELVAELERMTGGDRDRGMPRGRFDQKDDCTVRVTNLSEDIADGDLEALFGRIGKIQRMFLAKHKETQSSKGFAFITYEDRSTAEKAIQKLDRHGYDNLLLKVEWAKPTLKPRD